MSKGNFESEGFMVFQGQSFALKNVKKSSPFQMQVAH
jgi:hypothetical protein